MCTYTCVHACMCFCTCALICVHDIDISILLLQIVPEGSKYVVQVEAAVPELLIENACFSLCQIIHTIDECTDIVYTVTAAAVGGMVSSR